MNDTTRTALRVVSLVSSSGRKRMQHPWKSSGKERRSSRRESCFRKVTICPSESVSKGLIESIKKIPYSKNERCFPSSPVFEVHCVFRFYIKHTTNSIHSQNP